MNRTLRRAVGVAACTLALAATTGTAHAETQSKKDPRGDVEVAQMTRAGANAAIDVVSSTNTYKGSTLTMTLKAAKLAKSGYVAEWFIETDDATYILYNDRTSDNVVAFFPISGRPVGVGRVPAGVPPTCEGVTVKPSVRKSLTTGTVPRSCLGGADTVRVGAVLGKVGMSNIKLDDARRTGFDGQAMPKLGPALDRN